MQRPSDASAHIGTAATPAGKRLRPLSRSEGSASCSVPPASCSSLPSECAARRDPLRPRPGAGDSRRPTIRLALPIALALAGAAGPSSGNDDARILRDLERVVFGSEFVGQASMVLRKWVRPIRAVVQGVGRETDLGAIERARIAAGVSLRTFAALAPDNNRMTVHLSARVSSARGLFWPPLTDNRGV